MKIRSRYLFFLILIVFLNQSAFAQKKYSKSNQDKSNHRSLTWDLGFSAGSYGGYSYNEIDVGLNWYLSNYLNFRNVVFSRFGSSTTSTSGLDSSLRFEYANQTESGDFSYRLFAGPGVRISNTSNSGVFGEAGAVFKLGGLSLGGGVKSISYSSPGKDSLGQTLPANDISYFIIVSGGGAI